MSGKYRKCSAASISYLLSLILIGILFASEKAIAAPPSAPKKESSFSFQFFQAPPKVITNQAPTAPKEDVKDKLYINGFYLPAYEKNEIIGLRAKAVADLFFRKGNYSQAIKYYEQASKFITNEADIYYNLGNIYAYEKVYNMAANYYKIASDKYRLPENFGKTQRYYYIAMIRYGFSLEKVKDYENNHQKALKVASQLTNLQGEIKNNYPDVLDEMDKFNKLLYGETAVQKKE